MHGDAGGGNVKLLKQGPKKEWGCLPLTASVAVVLLAAWLVIS